MSQTLNSKIAVIGIDIGKNSFHIVGQDRRGALVLRQKWSRGQVEARLANLPPCLIGMEACSGAHHLSRKLTGLGHDARLMPAKYVRPYSKGEKNDYRDAEAIAEAVQRPTMKFVATKSADQLDLQALHRVRERLVGQRTGIINQIGSISRRGNRYLRTLFVQAAWVVLVKIRPEGWERYGLKSWIEAAKERLHRNVLAIALANKLARIAWAVLHKGRAFECVKTNASRPA
jgi:transposase